MRDWNFQAGQAAPRPAVAGARSTETLTVPLSQRKGQWEKGWGSQLANGFFAFTPRIVE